MDPGHPVGSAMLTSSAGVTTREVYRGASGSQVVIAAFAMLTAVGDCTISATCTINCIVLFLPDIGHVGLSHLVHLILPSGSLTRFVNAAMSLYLQLPCGNVNALCSTQFGIKDHYNSGYT